MSPGSLRGARAGRRSGVGRAPHVPGGESAGPAGNCPGEGLREGAAGGRGETKTTLIQSVTSGHCAFQRQCCLHKATLLQLPQNLSHGRGPTGPGHRPTEASRGTGGGAPSDRLLPPRPPVPPRRGPTPPPRARLPQPGRSRLAGGAAHCEGRARHTQVGAPIGRAAAVVRVAGRGREAGGCGTGGGCGFRNRRSSSLRGLGRVGPRRAGPLGVEAA